MRVRIKENKIGMIESENTPGNAHLSGPLAYVTDPSFLGHAQGQECMEIQSGKSFWGLAL